MGLGAPTAMGRRKRSILTPTNFAVPGSHWFDVLRKRTDGP